jgi:FkbM family methyltransferase
MSNPPRPLPFVIAATEQGTLIVNHLDYQKSGDIGWGVGYELLNFGSFSNTEVVNANMMLAVQKMLRGDGVVALDCGANIGIHTLSWARQMTGWGSVIAFEAQERIFYALAGNICISNCFNARAMNVAIGDTDGMMEIPVPDYTRPANFGGFELRRSEKTEFIGQPIDYAPAAMRAVPMVRIDSLNLPRVDMIKIDVEGMEKEVLIGARTTIERCRPLMLIEYHKSGLEQLSKCLHEFGYFFHQLGINLLAIPLGDPAEMAIKIT